MEIPNKAPVVRGKRQKPKIRITLPQTEEEKKAVQEILGRAYTEAAISIIKRKFANQEERMRLYDHLLELKDRNTVI